MTNSFASRPTALVTGALRGIGRECAIALSKSGFNVLLNDLPIADNALLSQRLVVEIGDSGAESMFFGCDVADLAQHTKLVETAAAAWGRIDCVVNNAGVGVAQRGDLLEVTSESFDRCIRVNTKAVFFLCQVVARHMLKQGEIGGQHRSIINGLELALATDLRIAVQSAKFGSPEVTLGMISGWMGIRRLAENIGVARARHLTLLGAPITAAQALDWGLVTALAADADDLERQLNGWLERLCANAPGAMALTKGILASMHADLRQHHASAAAQARSTEDCAEGVRAFREKRKPVYRNR